MVILSILDAPNSNYKHEIHIHGPNGNFGFGLHSTSPIEGVWSILKSNIKKIYNYNSLYFPFLLLLS